MQTDDFFRARIDAMINLNDPLAVLASRLDWDGIEASLAAKFERRERAGEKVETDDLFGTTQRTVGAGSSPAGRPRLPMRLMVSLLYLKHAFNLSDEDLVSRWSENLVWQFFSGQAYYEHRPPCDATQLGRFRRALGEEGIEQLLKSTIETAVAIKAIRPAELERVIVDSTVQSKAIAHPVDSRLLEIARHKVVSAARRAGISLKQTYAREGKELRRKAGGYAHAKQFKRLARTVKRQRTILGVVMREVQRKLDAMKAPQDDDTGPPPGGKAMSDLGVWLERAERVRTQKRNDKNKLYALHAPEVECISKGKARTPYEFGVKVSLTVTHKQGLMVGARSFPGNPYDGHVLSAQLEQTRNLLQDLGREPKQVVVDLGYRGVDADNPGVEIIHRGKYKTLSALKKRLLKRRQAIEPLIGHTKADHRMDRCWLQGARGDALHAISCAAGYNIRWLLRAIAALGVEALFLRLLMPVAWGRSGRGVKSIATENCWADLLVKLSLQRLVAVPATGAAI
jgi:IS5 family transposase